MGKIYEIKSAIYGTHGKRDVNITDYLLQNRYRISQTIDLTSEFGDPYPNTQKFIDVEIRVTDERTELYEEEAFKIKNGGGRIGFDKDVPFHIDIPNLYEYHVLDGQFQIIHMVVRPAQYANHQEVITVEASQWDRVVHKTPDGYYTVQQDIDIVEWMGADPFPYRQKIIEVSYRREASYHIRVYEHGGYLLKDFVPLVELPLQKLHLLYHLYPKFDHHLMPIHRRYLTKCQDIFDQMTVCIANENEEDEEMNESMTNELFGFPLELNIFHVESDKEHKDTPSFLKLLEHCATTKSDYALYCHSKGMTEYQLLILPNVACWVELSYIQLLANIDVVIEQNANFGGCFMETHLVDGKLTSWSYPGNFYWMKSSIVSEYVLRNSLLSKAPIKQNDIPKNFPKSICSDVSNCLNLLACREGLNDLYNRQSILQFKTLIESCAKDSMSRKAVGLL